MKFTIKLQKIIPGITDIIVNYTCEYVFHIKIVSTICGRYDEVHILYTIRYISKLGIPVDFRRKARSISARNR